MNGNSYYFTSFIRHVPFYCVFVLLRYPGSIDLGTSDKLKTLVSYLVALFLKHFQKITLQR